MKNKMEIYYDQQGDYLEINIGKPAKGSWKEIGQEIFEKIDKKTGKIISIGIMGFKKRTKNRDVKLPYELIISK